MVKIAIAGGSGNVGQEIFDALVATKNHEIVLLSRKEAPSGWSAPGTSWIKADYANKAELTKILQGVHTVLSFIGEPDPSAPIHKNLIDASVEAGVKRFAPSEWATSSMKHMGWYAYKAETRRYLEELNKDKKVLEYTLFQPGLFLNYLTAPHKSTKHVEQMESPIDFANCRILLPEGGTSNRITLTTAQDLANVVAKAVEYEGEWPAVGGIRGVELSFSELIALGEKIRGKPFQVEELKLQGLEDGTWTSTWSPVAQHHSMSPEDRKRLARTLVSSLLLAFHDDCFRSSDEWNRIFSDYQFTQPEEFLSQFWAGK